jgi:hypothetical protein
MIPRTRGKDFALRFVRHLGSDPNPAGLGNGELPTPGGVDGVFGGKEQPARQPSGEE